MPKSYQGVTSNIHIKSLNICNIAFDAFFEDTKALVAKGVRTDIAHQKASAPTKKLFAQISNYASRRESSLATWLKIDYPLAFQDTKGNNVYKFLLQAVSQDDHAVAQGLPNWSLFATTRLALAESLFLMSHPSHHSDQNTPTAKAPVLSTGSFFPVLKVVNDALVVLSRARDKEAIKSFILNTFIMSFDIFKVDFFPQCLPPTGVRSRPQSTPLFNSSITESKHIKAVKEPWRRSSRFEAFSQMLLINQRLDKLAAARVDFADRGMLQGTCLSAVSEYILRRCFCFRANNLPD